MSEKIRSKKKQQQQQEQQKALPKTEQQLKQQAITKKIKSATQWIKNQVKTKRSLMESNTSLQYFRDYSTKDIQKDSLENKRANEENGQNNYLSSQLDHRWRGITFFIIIVCILLIALYPIWPLPARIFVFKSSFYLLAGIVIFTIIRAIIYHTLWIFGVQFLIFPNLFEDVGVIDSFKPLFSFKLEIEKEWYYTLLRGVGFIVLAATCYQIYINRKEVEFFSTGYIIGIKDIYDWGENKLAIMPRDGQNFQGFKNSRKWFNQMISQMEEQEKEQDKNESKENGSKENESQENESEENESQENESKENESQENESEENESQENESQENDNKENEKKEEMDDDQQETVNEQIED